jgi:SRSO17 transposase
MKTTTRVPLAPSQPLPELVEFLALFDGQFVRSEARQALERYITGLLTEHPRKNCDTLAQVVPSTSEQRLQGLLTRMAWDDENLNRQRVQWLAGLPTEGDGVLIFDDTGFAKQGRSSVGVAWQYSGTLGKTANCQVTVDCHYAERTLAWPIATRLYLHESWAEDFDRRKKARVPAAVIFQTKPQIALSLLDQANLWGIRHSCVTADADYGDNPNFLAGLEKRRELYVVAIRSDFAVALGSRDAPAQRVDAVLESQPAATWRTVRWREGSQEWLRGRFVAVRCWRVTTDGQRHRGWLIGERQARGQRERWKSFWSNFGPQRPIWEMVEYAHRRHWVEQFHEEAKGELGWDQYQGRLWPGFHRHAAAVMLAYSFLVWRDWQQRQCPRSGRPRPAFSPPSGPTENQLAGGASPSERRAAARGAA